MWQLLWTITETINTLFTVVNFLKCVVPEVVLFSIVAFKTLDISHGSVATQLRCGGIFIANFLLIHDFKNRLLFCNVKAYKNCAIFGQIFCRERDNRWSYSTSVEADLTSSSSGAKSMSCLRHSGVSNPSSMLNNAFFTSPASFLRWPSKIAYITE